MTERFYIGRHNFRDDTASLAVNNVLSDQRRAKSREQDAIRMSKKAARRAVREREIATLDPVQQRIIELDKTITSFAHQVSDGLIGRERFRELTHPLRLEMRQLRGS